MNTGTCTSSSKNKVCSRVHTLERIFTGIVQILVQSTVKPYDIDQPKN